MKEYRFTIVLPGKHDIGWAEECRELLDASVSCSRMLSDDVGTIEISFTREARSLRDAVTSAVDDIESVYGVL